MAYFASVSASARAISGGDYTVAHIAGWLIAASILLAVFQIARRFATVSVAIATVICTALLPVFFVQISNTQFDNMAAASLTLWGLLLYLSERPDASSHGTSHDTTSPDTPSNNNLTAICFPAASAARVTAATLLFTFAAFIRATAVLTPLALVAWSLACHAFDSSRRRSHNRSPDSHHAHQLHQSSSPVLVSLIPMLAALPLTMWFAYHFARTGYVSGNTVFHQILPVTFNPTRIFRDAAQRLWYVTGYMNLWTLSLPALIAMMRPAIKDNGIERPRIKVNVQLVFLAVILAHVVALPFIKHQASVSDMLSVYPLAVLIYVSTLRRRLRWWLIVVAFACLAFITQQFST